MKQSRKLTFIIKYFFSIFFKWSVVAAILIGTIVLPFYIINFFSK